MLKKESCKKCIIKEDHHRQWTKADELNWDKKRVFCPCYHWRAISIDSDIHELKNCPYLLEHIIYEENCKNRE
jgi:hypothetical protein